MDAIDLQGTMSISPFQESVRLSRKQIIELAAAAEIELPHDYIAFLLRSNGGFPSAGVLELTANRKRLIFNIGYFAFIDSNGFAQERNAAECSVAYLAYVFRKVLPRQSIPVGAVNEADVLLLFTSGARRGTVGFKGFSEDLLELPDNLARKRNTICTGLSFSELVKSLREPLIEDY